VIYKLDIRDATKTPVSWLSSVEADGSLRRFT
jgi:hypothetical protein